MIFTQLQLINLPDCSDRTCMSSETTHRHACCHIPDDYRFV